MSTFKAGVRGNYKAPAHKNTMVRKNNMDDGDSVGVGSGLSARADFDGDYTGPMYDYEVDPLTGNSTERTEPYTSKSVSKKGYTFEIC